MCKKIIDRAAELLRKDPSIKYYEAIEIAKGEFHEVDRGAISGIPGKEKASQK